MTLKVIPRPPRAQRGISLVIVLILLLIMTLLGLAVLRSTLLEERMTANLTDRSFSFQAAEAALREAEVIASAAPAAPASGCVAGLCATPVAGEVDRWRDDAFTGWRSAAGGDARDTATSFFIEYMGEAPTWPGCDRMSPVPAQCLSPTYRITARSTEANRARVVLQTNYIVQ